MSMLLKEAVLQDSRLQDAIVNAIRKDFDNGKQFVLLKAGQRGGKTLVAVKIIAEADFKHVALITNSLESAKANLGGLLELVSTDDFCPTMTAGIPSAEWAERSRSLIILDEAMWIDNSYNLLTALLGQFPLARILVVSSRGPAYDADIRWQATAGYSATAWDLNPNLSQHTLIDDHLSMDPVTFIRDYCAF